MVKASVVRFVQITALSLIDVTWLISSIFIYVFAFLFFGGLGDTITQTNALLEANTNILSSMTATTDISGISAISDNMIIVIFAFVAFFSTAFFLGLLRDYLKSIVLKRRIAIKKFLLYAICSFVAFWILLFILFTITFFSSFLQSELLDFGAVILCLILIGAYLYSFFVWYRSLLGVKKKSWFEFGALFTLLIVISLVEMYLATWWVVLLLLALYFIVKNILIVLTLTKSLYITQSKSGNNGSK